MKTKLLVVDDSVVFRMFLRKCLMGLDALEVVGVARDGIDALEKVAELKPDVITLDMNMPRMNGMETLAALRRDFPEVKVIIIAAETEDDANRTVKALNVGAFDFILKPKTSDADPVAAIQQELLPRIEALQERRRHTKVSSTDLGQAAPLAQVASEPRIVPSRTTPSNMRMDILAIGSSTGGPAALHEVLPKLPANLPVPVTVVQHMPESFIRSLAARMDKESPLACKVAEDGEHLVPGYIYFGPGDWHLEIVSKDGGLFARLSDAAPMHFCRPAVDAMFHSLTQLAPRIHTLAVVLTGMGKDGAAGALGLAEQHGYVIAQDKETSTVWGMPGSTVNLGAAHRILPLQQISSSILTTLEAMHA